MPIHKRYKTRQTVLKYRRLGALQLYSDTLVAPAKMKSFRGKQYAQVFTSGEGLSLTYPMKHKSEAYKGLNCVMQKWGIPGTGGSGNSGNVYIVIPFSGGKIINPTSVFDGMISSRFFAK